ncbi:hypothetical protein ACFO3J_20150 [Streptomyces polygonati]|uniref:PknH-like extracellular domain-containing protein n=1 Tax=Streptomyces polygonati TaxID=1617087 RepID=A0ABV8HP02_9ACTN
MPLRIRTRRPARGPAGVRAAVLAVALLPALALTAGCGSGGGAKRPEPTIASDAGPAALLVKALLTSSDIPHVTVVPAAAGAQLLGGPQQVDQPGCGPIADQWAGRPAHPRQVYVGATVTDTAAADKNAKTISLEVIASYRPGEAASVLDGLTTALRTCRGYRLTRGGVTTSFQVRPVPDGGVRLGDQQVAYTLADTAAGARGTVLVTVVRSGDTTAAYETLRVDHKAAALRAAIPLEQTAKLRAAAGG